MMVFLPHLDLLLLFTTVFLCQTIVSLSHDKKEKNFLQNLHEHLPPTVKNRHHLQRNHHFRVDANISSDSNTDPLEGLTAKKYASC